jgi:hypothetical protein
MRRSTFGTVEKWLHLICIPPCLRVGARVPVGVKDDDSVCTSKVHTQSAHLMAAKEQ